MKFGICVPIRGPRLQNAMAVALSRSEKRSPTVPPPMPTGALPENPAKACEYDG